MSTPTQELCNCKQCQAIRLALRFVNYITNPVNKPLTVQEFVNFYPCVWERYPVAAELINKYAVLCKDGFIRMR